MTRAGLTDFLNGFLRPVSSDCQILQADGVGSSFCALPAWHEMLLDASGIHPTAKYTNESLDAASNMGRILQLRHSKSIAYGKCRAFRSQSDKEKHKEAWLRN